MKNQITITLAQIKKHSPLDWVWSRVLKANGGEGADLNKRFPVSSIFDSNGLDDTLEVLRCLPEYNVLWRKFAWWCAEQVKDYANDDRVSRCLEVVKRYNEGLATDEELAAAKQAALAAKRAASAAKWSAAEASAAKWSASAARWAASAAEAWSAAAWSAAEAAAAEAKAAAEAARWAAKWSAEEAAAAEAGAVRAAQLAGAEWSAAEAAAAAEAEAEAPAAARSAARSAQEIKLREVLDSGTWRD